MCPRAFCTPLCTSGGAGGLRNISIIYKRGDLYFTANKKTNQNMLVYLMFEYMRRAAVRLDAY